MFGRSSGHIMSNRRRILTASTSKIVTPKSSKETTEIESPSKIVLKMCKNPLTTQSIAERLYANKDKTGDIKFKIDSDEIIAHKCVLAAYSPKYEAQFYGDFDDAKADVIEVKDVTPAAFNEFLQFFYLDKFSLTYTNIEHVISLIEASRVEEFIVDCVKFLKETLSVETVCHTYYLAIKHGYDELIESCERKMSLHSDEVFASDGFYASSREVVFNILQLDSLNCKEIDVFNACIKWAKQSCESETDMKKLRAALVDPASVNILHEIRFGTMTIEEFMLICYKTYKDIFTEDEKEEIFFQIGKVNDLKSKRFNDEPRGIPYKKWDEINKIECNRTFSETNSSIFYFGKHSVIFSCNRPILIGGFYCGCLINSEEKSVLANVSVIQKHNAFDADGKTMLNNAEQIHFGTKQEASVKLQRPIFINPQFMYEIQIELKEGLTMIKYEFRREVPLNNYAIVKFHDNQQISQGFVTCLILNLCEDDKDDEMKYL